MILAKKERRRCGAKIRIAAPVCALARDDGEAAARTTDSGKGWGARGAGDSFCSASRPGNAETGGPFPPPGRRGGEKDKKFVKMTNTKGII